MAEGFQLAPALARFARLVGDLPLCQVRLADDQRYPWLILVPRVAGATEIEDLPPSARTALIHETVAAGRAVREIAALSAFRVDKLNIGALGNVTPQLHVHVVGRQVGDPAWPGPVWGVGGDLVYTATFAEQAITRARFALGL